MAAGQKEQMDRIRTCPVCGREFTDRTRKYCSPKCSNEGYRKRQAKYSIEKYHTEKDKQNKEGKKPKKESSLERLAREAREARMTYGQYVALGYAERIQNARHKTDQSGQI